MDIIPSLHRLTTFFILCFLLVSDALSQTDIYIQGSGRLFPIALPQLCLQRGDTTGTVDIPKIIGKDLDLSGYFEVLSAGAYIETPGKCPGPDGFAYSDWSVIGAEGLVRGTIEESNNGLKIQLYLHDVQRQRVVLGKEYEGDASQIPKIAHRFANEIMRFFTGIPGVFGTRISFSSKVGRFKELYLMDMDGSNLRQLTNEKGLALSSSWDTAGLNLVYTSYRQRMPDLFLANVESRGTTRVTQSEALEIGGKFAPNGKILGSLTSGLESDIVLFGKDGRVTDRLTKSNGAIDVSPDWSPDRSKIVFCSNRAGGPQIYTMNADGSEVRRISFVNSNYCTSPDWSPGGEKGERIAFVCRADAGFQVFTSRPDGSDSWQLTSFGNNEDPDWSPDGRYIVFATTFGKGYVSHLALMREDGSGIKQLTNSRSGDSEPSWGPLID